MKEKIVELVGEKLTQINDVKQQVDIAQYIIDIEFFNSKINKHSCLADMLPKKYHDLTVGDFVSLSDKQLKKKPDVLFKHIAKNDRLDAQKLLSIDYSIDKYNNNLDNFNILLNSLPDDDMNITKGEMLAKFVLEHMRKSDELFNAGVALFHDDKDIQETAKQYRIKRN